MKFENLIDLIQYFANEYCKPNFKVLILGNTGFKEIFSFINSEVFCVHLTPQPGVDFVVPNYTDLPFERWSFDIVLNFTKSFDLFYLTNGPILTVGEILNGTDYYHLINNQDPINNQIYTVLT